MPSTAPLEVDLIVQLRSLPVANGTVVLLVGAVTLTDGLGGFYRFDATSTAAEDTRFFNVVASSVSTVGRWVRIFQRIRVMPGGYLVMNGGFKSYFTSGVLNASGQITAYLTDDGTASGNPLFTEVWVTAGDVNANGATANETMIGSKKSLTTDLKTLVYQFVKGASRTLTGVLGLTVPGLQVAPAGTQVTLRIDGV